MREGRVGYEGEARWRVEEGTVPLLHVETAYGSLTAHLGDTPPEVLASVLLGELVRGVLSRETGEG